MTRERGDQETTVGGGRRRGRLPVDEGRGRGDTVEVSRRWRRRNQHRRLTRMTGRCMRRVCRVMVTLRQRRFCVGEALHRWSMGR